VMSDRKSPCLGSLVRIGWADDCQARYSSEAGEVLDWLMSGAILAESDAVVCKYVDNFEAAQRPESDGGLHVVGKREKRCAERQHTAMGRHSIHHGAHCMLTNTERDVPAGIAPFSPHRTQCSRP